MDDFLAPGQGALAPERKYVLDRAIAFQMDGDNRAFEAAMAVFRKLGESAPPASTAPGPKRQEPRASPSPNGHALKPNGATTRTVKAALPDRSPYREGITARGQMYHELTPTAIADRLVPRLLEHGQEHFFTTEQLMILGLGDTLAGIEEDPERKSTARVRWDAGRRQVHRTLKERGFLLKNGLINTETKQYAYWIEPLQKEVVAKT